MLDAPEAAPSSKLPVSDGTDALLLEAAVPRRWPWERLSTMGWFALSLLTIPIAMGLGALRAPWPLLAGVWLLGAVLLGLSTLIALFRALHGALALVLPASAPSDVGMVARIADILGNLFMAGLWHAHRLFRDLRLFPRSPAAAFRSRALARPSAGLSLDDTHGVGGP